MALHDRFTWRIGEIDNTTDLCEREVVQFTLHRTGKDFIFSITLMHNRRAA